jgi:hypothetical protein
MAYEATNRCHDGAARKRRELQSIHASLWAFRLQQAVRPVRVL